MSTPAGPLHAYLAGLGPDARGRLVSDVLAFSDEALEETHDFIQWLFPLPTRSGAQPDAPVLGAAEAAAIRGDGRALANLERAAARMMRFYEATDHWRTRLDHNHLRVTRIVASLRLLAGEGAARDFHGRMLALNEAAGAPVNARSLAYWRDAAEGA